MADTDRVLVAYGTKHGATAEIAEALGRTLSECGLQVDIKRAQRMPLAGHLTRGRRLLRALAARGGAPAAPK